LQVGARSDLGLSCFFGGNRRASGVELFEDLFVDRLPCLLDGIELCLKLGLSLPTVVFCSLAAAYHPGLPVTFSSYCRRNN